MIKLFYRVPLIPLTVQQILNVVPTGMEIGTDITLISHLLFLAIQFYTHRASR